MTSPSPVLSHDVVAALAGIAEGSPLAEARARRVQARDHAQGSFAAIFLPSDTSEATLTERAAVALFVAAVHGQASAVSLYGALLRETGGGAGVEPLIVAEAERARGAGPYGRFHGENAPESVAGPVYTVDSLQAAYALGDRLSAALEHAHMLVLHPRDAERAHLQRLLDAGWSTTGIVTLSQLISFLSFQLRVVDGLLAVQQTGAHAAAASQDAKPAVDEDVLAALAAEVATLGASRASGAPQAGGATEQLPPAPRVVAPARFTQDVLGWKPWLEPLPVAEFTERHYEALIERERVHMPYFRLLARDPDALRERTLTDLDIFTNPDAGLPRADRELAAAAASRLNGCVFCASVHARFAVEQGADRAEVQRLLDEGVETRIDDRRDRLVDAVVALTVTPSRIGPAHIAALSAVGLGTLDLLDAIQAGAFFNWANRLMLSLGEPTV